MIRLPWLSAFFNIQILVGDWPPASWIGFSYTNDGEAGIARNQEEVALVLYEVMRQFYIINPELEDRDLYITGESYGGKYLLGNKSPTMP